MVLLSYAQSFQLVFTKEDFDILSDHCQWDYVIELLSRAEPKFSKVYPISPAEQLELDIFLSENFHTRQIYLSKSPMATLVFFIKKKDSSLWLMQDYRNFNVVTIKNKYPLFLISKLISQLQRAKYFTKLNVYWDFNNVQIKPGNEWKTTFHTNYRLFKPLVMFFSMTNSTATFKTIMNDIFHNLIAKGIMIVYLNDILIFTQTLEKHHIAVQKVLEV